MKRVNKLWYVKFEGVWFVAGKTIEEAFYYFNRLGGI